MNTKLTVGILSLIFGVFLVISLYGTTQNGVERNFRSKQLNIILRGIGHDLLMAGGDSTGRVLPVKQVDDITYEIAFENKFNFVPDTLRKIVEGYLAKTDMKEHYMVNVIHCNAPQIIYGYEYNLKVSSDLTCSGRVQEKGCYKVQIIFPRESESSTTYFYIGLTGFSFVAIAFLITTSFRKNKVAIEAESIDLIQIGNYKLSPAKGLLKVASDVIELSDKESKILQMLVASPNELVLREKLMKHIWENDGVFVGRSLDVFISKLRKKLLQDENVKIINVHGRGYKLIC